jgi:predicted transcriptional regulator
MKTLVKLPKTITFSLPMNIGKEILAAAKEDDSTVTELIKKAVLRYRGRKLLHKLAAQGQKNAKRLGLTPEDFGGPFAQ